jgi:hypothetical protein
VNCPKCGQELPENTPDLNYCYRCGLALNGVQHGLSCSVDIGWEYKDIKIPLMIENDFDYKPGGGYERAIWQCNNVILSYLQGEGREGWQAEELTDFRWLLAQGKVDGHDAGIFTSRQMYDSVTIRLRRVVRR